MWLPLSIFVISYQIFAVTPAAVSNTDRSNAFNLGLLQTIIEGTDRNVVISPLNIKVALTTLIEGTEGNTRQQILSTLGLPTDVNTLRDLAKKTVTSLSDEETGTELLLATRLFTGEGKEISGAYSNALQTYYKSGIETIDFRDTINAADAINDWVEEATNHIIPSAVEAGTLSPDTAVLLASTLYFKGRWLDSFYEEVTTKKCFNVPGEGCQDTFFMRHSLSLNHCTMPSIKAQVLELPYENERYSMLLFLPENEGLDNLRKLAKDLAKTPVSTILDSFEDYFVNIEVPKFTVETKQDLKSVLAKLGIKDLFDSKANLSGIFPNTPAKVDNILHNAKIEVTETGTVGAAFTGYAIMDYNKVTEQLEFNRPFLFTILDRESYDIIFAGQIVRP